ncbi:MAG: succinate:quinone oxidoreductase [Planctomycetota bacterium]|nr:MAG: succinate:quinone oxidoreductase [Planctomycetota bacterium]
MTALSRMFGSTVGRKSIVALTGLMLVLFLLGHLLGNLLLYAGQDAMNSYAERLHSLGMGLWVIRAMLLAIFVLHITLAIRLNLHAASARPVPYAKKLDPQVSSFATRSMVLTGLVVLAYLVYHILHFTVGVIQPDGKALIEIMEGGGQRADVYNMVVTGFQNPLVSISYIVAMALLALHLKHGITSFFQTLGMNHPSYNGFFEKLGMGLSLILFLGFSSLPVTCLLGIVKVAKEVSQ